MTESKRGDGQTVVQWAIADTIVQYCEHCATCCNDGKLCISLPHRLKHYFVFYKVVDPFQLLAIP